VSSRRLRTGRIDPRFTDVNTRESNQPQVGADSRNPQPLKTAKAGAASFVIVHNVKGCARLPMRQRQRDGWMHQVESSQRNILFPDTAENEARFWRNIISGKRQLRRAQRLGIAIICGAVAYLAWEILRSLLAPSISAWLLLGLYGASFCVLRWRVRRALDKIKPRHGKK